MQFILGTVQFGSAYGVSNVTGKIPKTEVKKILDFSWKNGVSCLDTAPAYNDSERLIGINIEKKDWKIQTKTPFFEAKIISNIEVNLLTKMFKSSLLNLNRNKIESLMIHNCDDLFKPGGYKIINTLESLKKDGYISDETQEGEFKITAKAENLLSSNLLYIFISGHFPRLSISLKTSAAVIAFFMFVLLLFRSFLMVMKSQITF